MNIKGILRFLFALSIPALLVWFFLNSERKANLEVQQYQEEQKANPTTDNVIINDYQIREVDDENKLRWQLISKQGKIIPETKDVDLYEVLVEYYEGPLVKMKLKAPKGIANEHEHWVELLSSGNTLVRCESDGGKSRFSCKKVKLTKKNQFQADGGVIIEWAEVAKVTGDQATGVLGSSGVQTVTVRGNTHSIITAN